VKKNRKRRKAHLSNDDLPAFRKVMRIIVDAATTIGERFACDCIDRDERGTPAASAGERHADPWMLEGMVEGAGAGLIELMRRGLLPVDGTELDHWRAYLTMNPTLVEVYCGMARVHILASTLTLILDQFGFADSRRSLSMTKVVELGNACCRSLDHRRSKVRWKQRCFSRETIEVLTAFLDQELNSYGAACDTYRIFKEPVAVV
jgi:hypothetical protein